MSDDSPRGPPGLDPDDLDISESEYVRELGEDRYVVSPGRRPRAPPADDEEGDADASRETDEDSAADPELAERLRTEGLPAEPDRPSSAEEGGPLTTDAAAAETGHRGRDASAGRPARSGGGTPTPAPEPESAPRADAGSPAERDDGLPADPTDGRPASHDRRGAPRGETAGDAPDGHASGVDASAVGRWLAASLADSEFAYGFDATLSVDGETTRHRMASNDVVETFETLATWFAGAAAGDDTPPDRVLGILLAEMDASPRLPPNAVRAALSGHGLSADDSVADLLRAVDEAGGLRLR